MAPIVTEKILRRKIGLGNDLSESGCEDQPFNERANLQRTHQLRRNWSPVLGTDYPPMVKSVKYE
jgi:hypothetical protein